jgi:hypothetical protein
MLTEANQMRIIGSEETKRRLGVKVAVTHSSKQGNKAILDAIDNRTVTERVIPGTVSRHPGTVQSADSRASPKRGGVIDRVSAGAARKHPASVGFRDAALAGSAASGQSDTAAGNAALLAKIRQQASAPNVAQPTAPGTSKSPWARMMQWLFG